MEYKKFLKRIFTEICGARILVLVEVFIILQSVAFLLLGVFMHLNNDVLDMPELAGLLDNVHIRGSLTLASLSQRVPYLVISVAAIAIIVVVLGLVTVRTGKRRLLVMHIYLTVLLFITLLIVVALLYVMEDEIDSTMNSQLITVFVHYDGVRSSNPTSIGWDYIFLRFECCGVNPITTVNNSHEFNQTVWWSNTTDRNTPLDLVPPSCCTRATEANYRIYTADIACQRTLVAHWKTGCSEAIQEWATRFISQTRAVGVVLLVFELLTVPLSCFLCVLKDHASVIV